MKFFRSLLAKYMLIIVTAVFLIQLIFIITPMFFIMTDKYKNDNDLEPKTIEKKWHDEAKHFKQINKEEIENHFAKWKKAYASAGMFWVNGDGKLVAALDVDEKLPKDWTAISATQFIKERYDNDPFTVIAFVGKDGGTGDGFIVFEIPRNDLNKAFYEDNEYVLILTGIGMISLFILASFLFFRSIRKRLLQLKAAMEVRDIDDLPIQITVHKHDEIGQLEMSFNEMVEELKNSKHREEEEEQLRRKLIANLSHDLRTPLTKIRANTYTLTKEDLTNQGRQSVESMEKSIKTLDRLIENLMSYTLLKASRYNITLELIDITRIVRKSLASWYPLFEQEGIVVHAQLEEMKDKKWLIDRVWMERILDNLFQNVLRHAKDGKYIGVWGESTESYDALFICDKGPGMNDQSKEAGVGIGLSIVDMMVHGMKLTWKIDTSENGTVIKIIRNKKMY